MKEPLIKAFLLGDNTRAPYHPLEGAEKEIRNILGDGFDIHAGEERSLLSRRLEEYKLVISYADCWDTPLSDEDSHGLIAFVAKGGGLLVLHNGISLASRREIMSLMGARFVSHPDSETLTFFPEENHPVSAGESSFEIYEEPYRYEFANTDPIQVFLSYGHQGEFWPAGWTKFHGLGRVACLHPGHSVTAFVNEVYRNIVIKSALWCVNMLN